MDDMGYTNFERVEQMSQRGVFSTYSEKTNALLVNKTAQTMMFYMAMKSINAEDGKAYLAKKPYWVYWGGWERMAVSLGWTLTPLRLEDENADLVVEAHRRTVVSTLSRTARFLQDRGAIKLLRPASTIGTKRNATWLLLLGDDAENAAAEAWARECLNLPEG